MFIDNIKYPAAMLVALFSLFFVVGCGSGQNKDPIHVILDELSHSTCDELPHEICLSAAAANSHIPLLTVLELHSGGESAKNFFLSWMTEEEALDAARLLRDHDIEDVLDELIRRENTRDLNAFESMVKTQAKVFLISRKFTENIQQMDYSWIARNHEKLRSTSKKCQAEREQFESYETSSLNVCAGMTLLIELEQQTYYASHMLPIEPRIRDNMEEARDFFGQTVEMAKQLGREAHLARSGEDGIPILW